jgi:hypothetical protein
MKIKGLIISTILSAIILGSCGESSIKNAKMQTGTTLSPMLSG